MAARAAIVLAVGLLASTAAAPAAALVELTDVRVTRDDTRVTVEAQTSAWPRHEVVLIGSPWRVVIDFQGTAYRWRRAPLVGDGDPIREIRGSQYRKSVTRLVIELARRVPYSVAPYAGGLRVVLGAPASSAPPAPVPRPRPADPGGAAPLRPVLQGIVVSPEGPVAYLLAPGAEQARGYRVGDRVDGGRIEAIGERHVVLETADGPVELRLHISKPGTTR